MSAYEKILGRVSELTETIDLLERSIARHRAELEILTWCGNQFEVNVPAAQEATVPVIPHNGTVNGHDAPKFLGRPASPSSMRARVENVLRRSNEPLTAREIAAKIPRARVGEVSARLTQIKRLGLVRHDGHTWALTPLS